MPEYPRFSIALNIADSNTDRAKAFLLYQKAFGAIKLSEGMPPEGGDLHIMMEINGIQILLAPGGENVTVKEAGKESTVVCQVQFDSEIELRAAYDALCREGREFSIGSYPWARVGALVTDVYGVQWWLCYHPQG